MKHIVLIITILLISYSGFNSQLNKIGILKTGTILYVILVVYLIFFLKRVILKRIQYQPFNLPKLEAKIKLCQEFNNFHLK